MAKKSKNTPTMLIILDGFGYKSYKKNKEIEEINGALQKSAEGKFRGILEDNEDPIVSCYIVCNAYSCVFEIELTSIVGNQVQLIVWYDNEFGYSNRLTDMILKIPK